jgi:predicted nucleic acid-binding protein
MLVDTNVVSELMRPKPAAKVIVWAEDQERFHLSVLTLEEVLFGLSARPSPRLSRWFDALVAEHCDVLAVSPAIARRAALLRGALRRQGQQRTQADALIAATAYEHGLALATRNVRDFEGCAIPLINPFE